MIRCCCWPQQNWFPTSRGRVHSRDRCLRSKRFWDQRKGGTLCQHQGGEGRRTHRSGKCCSCVQGPLARMHCRHSRAISPMMAVRRLEGKIKTNEDYSRHSHPRSRRIRGNLCRGDMQQVVTANKCETRQLRHWQSSDISSRGSHQVWPPVSTPPPIARRLGHHRQWANMAALLATEAILAAILVIIGNRSPDDCMPTLLSDRQRE